MKTIKIFFAVLSISAFFMACEADSINDEVGIEEVDVIGEDEAQETTPS